MKGQSILAWTLVIIGIVWVVITAFMNQVVWSVFGIVFILCGVMWHSAIELGTFDKRLNAIEAEIRKFQK
jgi:membrane-bound ClpP family serine protease